MYEHSPLVWLRLNADGVLLALLAFAASLDLLRPDASDLARELGYVPPVFYVWTICYTLGGILMLAGFVGRSIGLELTGRLLLCFGFAVETFRIGTLFGWAHYDVWPHYVIGLFLYGACYVRARVLLSKEAVHITVGRRRR